MSRTLAKSQKAQWLAQEENCRSLRFEMGAPHLYTQKEMNDLQSEYNECKEKQESLGKAMARSMGSCA